MSPTNVSSSSSGSLSGLNTPGKEGEERPAAAGTSVGATAASAAAAAAAAVLQGGRGRKALIPRDSGRRIGGWEQKEEEGWRVVRR